MASVGCCKEHKTTFLPPRDKNFKLVFFFLYVRHNLFVYMYRILIFLFNAMIYVSKYIKNLYKIIFSDCTVFLIVGILAFSYG